MKRIISVLMFGVLNKKLRLSFALAGFFGIFGSANAAGLCFQGDDEHCLSGRFGVGGLYSNFSGSGAGVNNYGGFVNVEVTETYKRFQAMLGIRVEGGGASFKGSTLANLGLGSAFFGEETKVKLGANVLTKRVPLFINFVFGNEYYSTNFGTVQKRGFERLILNLGLELQGAIPLGGKSRLEYSAGASAINAYYVLAKTYEARSRVDDFGLGVSASVGFANEINDRYEWYARVVGKYQKLGTSKGVPFYQNGGTTSATINYPASNNFAGMLEVGLGF